MLFSEEEKLKINYNEWTQGSGGCSEDSKYNGGASALSVSLSTSCQPTLSNRQAKIPNAILQCYTSIVTLNCHMPILLPPFLSLSSFWLNSFLTRTPMTSVFPVAFLLLACNVHSLGTAAAFVKRPVVFG